ncbi:MAG: helix-turn-helix domain-containing protein [Candidatus Scatovivens sp.]
MQLSTAIKKRINQFLKENNMKVWDLCEKSGVACSTISTFMNDENAVPKLPTLLHICNGFNITLGEFFSDPIFDDAEFDKD